MYEGSITIRLGTGLPEIERLSRLVRQFGELHEIPARALYALHLALDELVTNVILYGFDDPADQTIQIHVEIAGSELKAIIADEGRSFNPLEVPAPDLSASLGEREMGGLGVHLARSLVDHAAYQRDGSKNVLTIRKRIR